MARQKLSEYRSKCLLYQQFAQTYSGHQVTPTLPLDIDQLEAVFERWVAKVDQGIKKRGKLGLMKANLRKEDIEGYISKWQNDGYEYFIVEPMIDHAENDERYLSLDRTSDGVQLSYSPRGGMEIEEHTESVSAYYLHEATVDDLAQIISISPDTIRHLLHFFNKHHFSLVEINPFIILDEQIVALDAASYIDDTAQLLVRDSWTPIDFRRHASGKTSTPQEDRVTELASSSQASFRYEIINPDGAVFMLLSGGGASVVLADEVFNRGAGKLLANYGEYSGNPNEEETYIYTQQILESLLASKAPKKVLVIAGGVANFTDIRSTFLGIRRALAENVSVLNKLGVKVYIRRGGPHEAEALRSMEQFLKTQGLLGSVGGSKTVITEVINHALKELA